MAIEHGKQPVIRALYPEHTPHEVFMNGARDIYVARVGPSHPGEIVEQVDALVDFMQGAEGRVAESFRRKREDPSQPIQLTPTTYVLVENYAVVGPEQIGRLWDAGLQTLTPGSHPTLQEKLHAAFTPPQE